MTTESPRVSPLRAVIIVSLGALLAVVLVLTIRPGVDNAGLVTQILGFASTILMATLAYLKSTETRDIVDGRMDEFMRIHNERAILLASQARAEGHAAGVAAANERTDAIGDKADRLHNKLTEVHDLVQVHDEDERKRWEQEERSRANREQS